MPNRRPIQPHPDARFQYCNQVGKASGIWSFRYSADDMCNRMTAFVPADMPDARPVLVGGEWVWEAEEGESDGI